MKKNFLIAAVLLLIGSLVACNGLPFMSSTTTNSRRSSQSAASFDPANMSIESKVGIGILKLEGTDQAIDAETAKKLLPLFQALKTLSANNTTAIDEITALNKQIKNTLTADQLSAIQSLTFTSADIQTLMASHGLAGAGSASNTASRASSNQAGGMGGPPDAGGVPGVGGFSGAARTSSTTRVQSTPNAAAALVTARKTAGGFNLTFVDAIIELLQSKTA